MITTYIESIENYFARFPPAKLILKKIPVAMELFFPEPREKKHIIPNNYSNNNPTPIQ